jgi:hypothetical protein
MFQKYFSHALSIRLFGTPFHQFSSYPDCSYQDLDAPEDEVTVMDYRSL